MRDIDPSDSIFFTSGYLEHSKPGRGGVMYDIESLATPLLGSMVGGAVQSNAVSDAAEAQARSSAASIAENARQYDQTRADYAPYREAGTKALSTFAAENDIPLNPNSVQLDPGYQFGLNQGLQALNRQTAAAGGRISGAALKAAAQYGTDYATTGYGAAYTRANQARTDRLNRLAALAGIGQTATQNTGSLGAQNSAANSMIRLQAGDNAGAAKLAQANIWSNAGNQIAALYGRNSGGFTPNFGGAGTAQYDAYAPTAFENGGWGIE